MSTSFTKLLAFALFAGTLGTLFYLSGEPAPPEQTQAQAVSLAPLPGEAKSMAEPEEAFRAPSVMLNPAGQASVLCSNDIQPPVVTCPASLTVNVDPGACATIIPIFNIES